MAACQRWSSLRPRAVPTSLPTHPASGCGPARPGAVAGDLAEADGRPSKRRRVTAPLPGARSGTDAGAGLAADAACNGCAAAAAAATTVLRLPDYPTERVNGLRIQVYSLFPQGAPRLRFRPPSPDDGPAMNVRCKITILTERDNMPLLLYSDAQLGTVQTYNGTTGPRGLASIRLQPYVIPLDKIAMLNEHTGVFGLAKKYQMRIDIESTGGNEAWPPLDLLSVVPKDVLPEYKHHRRRSHSHSHSHDSKQQAAAACVLYAFAGDLFGQPRVRCPLWLKPALQVDPICTQYAMDVDIRWTTGFLDVPRKLKQSAGTLPTIVARDLDDEPDKENAPVAKSKRADALLNGHGHAKGSVPNGLSNGSHGLSKGLSGLSDGLPNGLSNGLSNGHVNGVGRHGNHTNELTHGPGYSTMDSGLDEDGNETGEKRDGGNDDDEDDDVDDDDDDSQSTPTRALRRRRDQLDYNLRNITNKAHGKGLRSPRKKMGRILYGDRNGALGSWSSRDGHGALFGRMSGLNGLKAINVINDDDDDLDNAHRKVVYLLPPHQLVLQGFVCCMCGARHSSMKHLRAHFLLSHWHYKFDCEVRTGTQTVKITHCPDLSDTSLPSRVFQLGRPTRPLDLDRFLAGDESWIVSRYGAENDASCSAPGVYALRPKPKHRPPPAKGFNLVVPHTKQPLYDPLSKALLVPGAKLRPTFVDDGWLVHKHREVVQDYSDLSAAEKEFIQEWDRFIIAKRISTDAYIPRAMIEFVEEKAIWLVADQARCLEFGKHTAVMVAKSLLSDSDLNTITTLLNAARKRLKEDPEARLQAEADAIVKFGPHRSKSGCTVCGLPVLGPLLLICSNKSCSRKLYHSACIKDRAKIPVKNPDWYCNNCAHLAPTQPPPPEQQENGTAYP